MKYKKLFIGIVLLSIWLAGCENDLTNPTYQGGPSQTTSLGTIELKAKYYESPPPYWDGGWECDPHAPKLALANLMPNGEIKNNTAYKVTVSGTSSIRMDGFQYVFTIPGQVYFAEWRDLSDVPDPMTIEEGNFSFTGTLTTKEEAVISGSGTKDDPHKYVKDLLDSGSLAFTNHIEVDPSDHDVLKATLSNVVITITEK